jgi:hypothetical protein
MIRNRRGVSRLAIPIAGLAIVVASFVFASDAAADTGALQGHVTDAATGEAIEGALVVARGGHPGPRGPSGGGGLHGFHAWTDSSGFYVMDGLPVGLYEVHCGAEGYLLADAEATIESGQITTLDFALEALVFGEVTGIVTDAVTGEPIEGAHVVLHQDRNGDPSGGFPPFVAVTAADGSYLIDHVPAGEYLAVAEAWGYLRSEPVAVVVEDGSTTVVDFALEPISFGILEGLVVDAVTGEPVAGAMVHVHLMSNGGSDAIGDSGGNHGGFNWTETDDNGFYRFEELVAGSYVVNVWADGYHPATGEAEVLDGQTTVLDFSIEPILFGSVVGTVTDAVTGAGIPDAMVILFRAAQGPSAVRGGDRPWGWLYARTDADGSYVIDEVPAGDYALWVTARGYEWMEPMLVTVTQGEPTVVDIVLQPLAYGSVEGVVRDGVTGEPIARALIFARRGWFGELATDHGGGFARAITDDQGRFVLEELATGTWDIMAFAYGYQRGMVEAVVEEGQTTVVEIILEPR